MLTDNRKVCLRVIFCFSINCKTLLLISSSKKKTREIVNYRILKYFKNCFSSRPANESSWLMASVKTRENTGEMGCLRHFSFIYRFWSHMIWKRYFKQIQYTFSQYCIFVLLNWYKRVAFRFVLFLVKTQQEEGPTKETKIDENSSTRIGLKCEFNRN